MSSSSSLAPTVDNEEIRQQKQVMRKQIRTRMKELSKEKIDEQSLQVWERLFALPAYQEAKSIGLFLSMPRHEINTDMALKDAIHKHKTVYVPEVGQNFEMNDMELIRVVLSKSEEEKSSKLVDRVFHHDWPKNKWQIPEPPSDMPRVPAKPGDIDLLVVPGLCFDRKGGRLGQGKGYYDRFISRIQKDSKPKLVAVGLDPQLVESIPMADHDFRMEMILLPDETIVVVEGGES
jgi:5-formyltetrahydrofolate cyclo-ligase